MSLFLVPGSEILMEYIFGFLLASETAPDESNKVKEASVVTQ